MSPAAIVTALDSCMVGVLDASPLAQSVKVSPNPSHGAYDVSFVAERKGNYTLRVTNTLGQVVFSEELQGFRGTYSKQIDLSGSGLGIYFLSISSAQEQVVRKLVRQ